MSTDLERFRDHARTMAAPGAHRDDCHHVQPIRGTLRTRTVRPDPACTGCIPAADRALFARLADEVDHHLADPPALFEAYLTRCTVCSASTDCDAPDHVLCCPSTTSQPQGDHP